MIHYLHKQAADQVKTREMLIQMKGDLEKEINDKDEENKRIYRRNCN
jgi:hypothetical protein